MIQKTALSDSSKLKPALCFRAPILVTFRPQFQIKVCWTIQYSVSINIMLYIIQDNLIKPFDLDIYNTRQPCQILRNLKLALSFTVQTLVTFSRLQVQIKVSCVTPIIKIIIHIKRI